MNCLRQFPINCILIACITSLMCIPKMILAGKSQPIISQIEFSATPLSEAIEFFRVKSLELHPPGKRINFVINSEVDDKQPITLRLHDVPIGVAIIYMIDYADLDYRIDTHACFVLPRGEGQLAKKIPFAPAKVVNFYPAKKARQTVLKKIEFIETPIQSVLEFLVEKSAEELPHNKGINLVLNRYIDPEMPVSLRLNNVPISGILSAIAELTSLEIRIEPHAIFFDPPGTKALHLATIRTDRLRKLQARPQRPQTRGEHYYKLGVYPNDPRSRSHPDYIDSSHSVISKRTNALNNVYKWVNGKWTFVRHGLNELGEGSSSLKKTP